MGFCRRVVLQYLAQRGYILLDFRDFFFRNTYFLSSYQQTNCLVSFSRELEMNVQTMMVYCYVLRKQTDTYSFSPSRSNKMTPSKCVQNRQSS